jgi:hypothetical protein
MAVILLYGKGRHAGQAPSSEVRQVRGHPDTLQNHLTPTTFQKIIPDGLLLPGRGLQNSPEGVYFSMSEFSSSTGAIGQY